MIYYGDNKDLYIRQSTLVNAMVKSKTSKKITSTQRNNLVASANNTIDCGKNRKSKIWVFEKDPDDTRKVILRYESLSEKYKDLIHQCYGNPYDYVAKQPIKAMVTTDHEAESFYLDYRYNNEQLLSRNHVDQYTKAASWLNMIKEVNTDKKALKERLNLSLEQFYSHVMELFEIENVKLPKSARRLMYNTDSIYKRYVANGYSTLIHPSFGNSYAAKVNDEKSNTVLYNLLADPRQFDDVFIQRQYNNWAVNNGYEPISDGTVSNFRKKYKEELTYEREGLSAFKDTYSQKIRGLRPTAPLFLIENDDNHTDLTFKEVFIDEKGRKVTNDHARYRAIIVIDSFNYYVLGYAYTLGKVTGDLVKSALVNALYNIKRLTGSWHVPHEIKNDAFAEKALKKFYDDIGTRIKARHGNKHRGYQEQFFGSPHWKNCLKLAADGNYIGNNVTARNRGFNTEVYDKNAKNRPMIGKEGEQIIEQFIHNCRSMIQKNGLSKEQEWIKAWNELDEDKKKRLSDEQMLLRFGIEHNYRNQGTAISSSGINFQREGVEYNYTLDSYKGNLNGCKVSVIFDPFDMSRVLVTNHDDIRIMAHETRLIPRAIADHNTDSRIYMKALQQQQNQYAKDVINRSTARKEAINQYAIDPETILQAGVLEKGARQLAEMQINQLPSERKDDNEDFNPLELL